MLKLQYALLASLCLLPLAGTGAVAATAGVTAAVNQSARSIPPGGAVRTVVLGANIVQDETIETDGAGLVQILLADGTTFTVGPNSSITIDRFVYDPSANTAQVSATIGRGVFRFIGGRTSKTEGGVQLNTPVGTVGIRGGMADLNFTGQGGRIAQIDLLFGREVTLGGPNGQRLFQPGYSIVIGADGRPGVVKTPPGSASFIQQALAGRPGQSGGSGAQPGDDDVKNSDVASNNSGATPPPQVIPPPDLGAIELATPRPTDIHQVAGTIGGGTPQQDTYGKRGFASGLLFADGTVPLVLHDGRGKTRIGLDDEGGVVGGRMVVGMSATSYSAGDDFDVYDVDLSITHGDYPGAPGMTASFNGQPQYTAAIDAPNVPPSSEELCTGCDFVDWGAWYADFPGNIEGQPQTVGIMGNWISGDIVSISQYDQLASQYQNATVEYFGNAAFSVQYYYTDPGVTSEVHERIGTARLEWNFIDRSGVFELIDIGGVGEYPLFSASTPIDGEGLASGFFSGSGTSGENQSYLSAAGAFVEGGAGAIGTFSAYSWLDEDLLAAASGVFAVSDPNTGPPP